MNLQSQLKALESKAAALKAKIARQEKRAAAKLAKQLRQLPAKHGFASISALIAALKKLPQGKPAGRGPAPKPGKVQKRTRLAPEVKRQLVAAAMKPGADRKALAKKSGASINSINAWVSRARAAKKK